MFTVNPVYALVLFFVTTLKVIEFILVAVFKPAACNSDAKNNTWILCFCKLLLKGVVLDRLALYVPIEKFPLNGTIGAESLSLIVQVNMLLDGAICALVVPLIA